MIDLNTLIQNILATSTLVIALAFMISKFIWKPSKKTKKNCSESSCGCH